LQKKNHYFIKPPKTVNRFNFIKKIVSLFKISNIVKYYFNLKQQVFFVLIIFEASFIPLMTKLI